MLNPNSTLKKYTSLLLLFFVCSCTSKTKEKNTPKPGSKPPVNAEVYIVQPQALSQDIEVPGSLVPFEETELHPEVAGRVTGIYFREGTDIGKGALLVKLYDADLQAQLQKLIVQLSIAQKTEKRQEELLKISGISQQDYDLSLLEVNNLKADINILRTSIAKTTIRAPYSGSVGLRNISIGAYVTPQTVITTVRQSRQLKLEFTVPERYGTKMRPGKLVYFTIEGSGKNFLAKIIANENNITEDTRSLKVKAIVDKPDAGLIAGNFAKVKIELDANDAALMIPTQAIIPQARDKKVMAVRNGVASLETVTTGIRDSAMVEITSGLKTGDTILTTGLLSTRPGSRVQIVNASQAP